MSLHQKISKPFNKLTVCGRLQAELENKGKVQLGKWQVVPVAYGSVLFISKYKSQFKQVFCKGGRN